jgi:hypothetical protein
MTLNKEYKPTDPNAPVIQLNCITSPSSLLKHTGNALLQIQPKLLPIFFYNLKKYFQALPLIIFRQNRKNCTPRRCIN